MEKLHHLCRIKLLAFFVWAICLALASVQAKSVEYCDKKGNDYSVTVKKVEISPDPVATGKPATFNISASTGQTLAGGKVVIDVSYLGIHVHTETHDLCEESTCPMLSGDFVLSHTKTLPGFTPPGSYTLRMRIEDENKNLLTCFNFRFKIGFGASSMADS